MEVPKEWKVVAEGVDKMRQLFNLCLQRGVFKDVVENAEYLNAYGMLEYEIKRMMADAVPQQQDEEPQGE